MMSPKHILLCRIVFIFCLSVSSSLRAELPVLGDPSRQSISPAQEYQIGQNYYQTLKSNHLILDDVLINEYIQSLGQTLVSNSEQANLLAHFFVVKANTINAFALPGGFIGINSGLFMEAKNERELAGVLAHEVSHVTQRHIARSMNDNSGSSATMFAALLAALILGSQNPNAAAAIFYGGTAAAMQTQINFTRHNEYEADRIGVSVLRKSGINPEGMADFFETLLSKAETNNALSRIEFLRTHPLSSTRVAEARHRIQASDKQLRSDSLGFQLSRARILVQNTRNKTSLLKKISTANQANDLPALYMRALLLLDTGKYRSAITTLQTITQQLEHPWFDLALAKAYRLNQNLSRSNQVLHSLSKLYPSYLPVTLAYATSLNQQGKYAEAIQLLNRQIQHKASASAYKKLAQAYYANGQITSALEATSYQYELDGYIQYAAQQIENALKQEELKSSTRNRLQSRKDYLTALFNKHNN